jgi:hypothetical protein
MHARLATFQYLNSSSDLADRYHERRAVERHATSGPNLPGGGKLPRRAASGVSGNSAPTTAPSSRVARLSCTHCGGRHASANCYQAFPHLRPTSQSAAVEPASSGPPVQLPVHARVQPNSTPTPPSGRSSTGSRNAALPANSGVAPSADRGTSATARETGPAGGAAGCVLVLVSAGVWVWYW